MRSYEEVLRHVAQPAKAPVNQSYIICATPRSGSTLLCECLSLTGVAGVPDEWMLPSNESFAKASFALTVPFDAPGYLAEIIEKSKTPNGTFGCKMMWPEMEWFRRGERWNFALSGPAIRHSALLPNLHYLRMSRRDRMRQAISLYLAMKTNYWHKMRRDEHKPAPWPVEALNAELADPVTRAAAISDMAARLAVVERQEAEWDRFFASERIVPFDVEYETLSADPIRITTEILAFLGLPVREGLAFPRTWHMPMSDERNEILLQAWRERA